MGRGVVRTRSAEDWVSVRAVRDVTSLSQLFCTLGGGTGKGRIRGELTDLPIDDRRFQCPINRNLLNIRT